MRVASPTGRDYTVSRRWMPWRQRIPLDTELLVTILAGFEWALRAVLLPFAVLLRTLRILPWELVVRDTGARAARPVVVRERVRGWTASQKRLEQLGREIQRQYVDPDAPGFPVVITRDPVSMGDDTVDNTVVIELDDRAAEPTVATLLTALQARGRFVSISSAATTWALRGSTPRKKYGRPMAVFVLDPDKREMDLHPVADTSFRVAKGTQFHLEYLLVQSVERTLELIAADPTGKRSLREDRQA